MATEEIDNQQPPEIFEFPGDWQPYEDALFKIFQDTIVNDSLTFLGLPIKTRYFEPTKGKHFTFWHIISEGEKETERTPDMRRCERISWIAWVIKNHETHSNISYWESKRKSSKNFVIWYEEGQFAVVLSKRSTKFVLLSAYHVTSTHRIESFKRERDNYRKNTPKS